MAIKIVDLEAANVEVKTMLGDILKCLSFLSDLQKQIQEEVSARLTNNELITPEEAAAQENQTISFDVRLPFAAIEVLKITDDQRQILEALVE